MKEFVISPNKTVEFAVLLGSRQFKKEQQIDCPAEKMLGLLGENRQLLL